MTQLQGRGRGRLFALMMIGLVPLIAGQAPADRRARLLEIYRSDLKGYTIFRDAKRSQQVELDPQPVYVWTNPTRAGGQSGAVFVWTCKGRAEVVSTIFSFPEKGPRGVVHEFHSLATTVLDVTRSGKDVPESKTWRPSAPGIRLADVLGAPDPATSAVQRSAQLRDLSREFSGTTEDDTGRKWELRLLPKPLFRDQSTDPAVIDGAVFAFVSSAGTDPEALLVLEARKAPGSTKGGWQYAVCRYTDMSLIMRLKGKEILSVPFLRGTNPNDSYRVLEDRIIPESEFEPGTK